MEVPHWPFKQIFPFLRLNVLKITKQVTHNMNIILRCLRVHVIVKPVIKQLKLLFKDSDN